ncbi:hypothetical protein FWF74_03185 [Candidatus Saccharibacteria bacterium]|nr:hypothetical protein [Candidatus Saccharibacteria bacterium]MCL1962820.1 hypothetical protein [Candidatus Saccharibacteria bacterium]
MNESFKQKIQESGLTLEQTLFCAYCAESGYWDNGLPTYLKDYNCNKDQCGEKYSPEQQAGCMALNLSFRRELKQVSLGTLKQQVNECFNNM